MFAMITAMPRARPWTDEQLIEAVAESATLAEVSRRLGILPGKYDSLRAHIARLAVDASHIPLSGVGTGGTTRRPWTDEKLAQVVRVSDSVSEAAVWTPRLAGQPSPAASGPCER